MKTFVTRASSDGLISLQLNCERSHKETLSSWYSPSFYGTFYRLLFCNSETLQGLQCYRLQHICTADGIILVLQTGEYLYCIRENTCTALWLLSKITASLLSLKFDKSHIWLKAGEGGEIIKFRLLTELHTVWCVMTGVNQTMTPQVLEWHNKQTFDEINAF